MWRFVTRVRRRIVLAGAATTGGLLAAGPLRILPTAYADTEEQGQIRKAEMMAASAAESTIANGVTFVGGVAFLGFCAYMTTRYRTCSPSQLLAVYGLGCNKGKIVNGGGVFVLPVVQQFQVLSLEPMALNIMLDSALSKERIRVNIPAVFTVAIGKDTTYHKKAAERLLGLSQDEISKQAQEILAGSLRAVVATMDIDQIVQDRNTFDAQIKETVEDELFKLGLQLINVNITDIKDESGKIEAQAKRAAAQSNEESRVRQATEHRKGAIGVAEQDRDKMLKVSGSEANREIGIKQAARQQEVRAALIQADQVVRENSAKEMQLKSNMELQLKRAAAHAEGESKEREAKAGVLETEAKAFAAAALEQAKRVEAEKRAQLEAPAKAQKDTLILEAEAKAQQTIIEARGVAEATLIQMVAEAKGNFELLDKKAQGLGHVVEQCGSSDNAFKMMMLEHVDTLAKTSADAISNIQFDKVTVWDTGAGNGSSTTADFIRSLTSSLPASMEVIERVAGVKLPTIDTETDKTKQLS